MNVGVAVGVSEGVGLRVNVGVDILVLVGLGVALGVDEGGLVAVLVEFSNAGLIAVLVSVRVGKSVGVPLFETGCPASAEACGDTVAVNAPEVVDDIGDADGFSIITLATAPGVEVAMTAPGKAGGVFVPGAEAVRGWEISGVCEVNM